MELKMKIGKGSSTSLNPKPNFI